MPGYETPARLTAPHGHPSRAGASGRPARARGPSRRGRGRTPPTGRRAGRPRAPAERADRGACAGRRRRRRRRSSSVFGVARAVSAYHRQVLTMTIDTQPAIPDSNQCPMNESVIATLIARPPPHASAPRAARTRRDAPSGTGVSTASERLRAMTYSAALRMSTIIAHHRSPGGPGSNRKDSTFGWASTIARTSVHRARYCRSMNDAGMEPSIEHAASSAVWLRHTLEEILSQVRVLLDIDGCAFQTVDWERGHISPAAAWFETQEVRAALQPVLDRPYDVDRGGVTEAAIERGEPLLITDIAVLARRRRAARAAARAARRRRRPRPRGRGTGRRRSSPARCRRRSGARSACSRCRPRRRARRSARSSCA